MKTVIFILSLISASAFAQQSGYSYQGTLVYQGGYYGIQTQNNGFVALDDSTMSDDLKQRVEECMNKPVSASVNDGGMVDNLTSISCQ